jgi:hypothetical protein
MKMRDAYFSNILIGNGGQWLTCALGSQSFGFDLEDAPEWVIDMIMTWATSQVHYCSHYYKCIFN